MFMPKACLWHKLTYEQAMVVLLTTGHRQQVTKLPILNEKEQTL